MAMATIQPCSHYCPSIAPDSTCKWCGFDRNEHALSSSPAHGGDFEHIVTGFEQQEFDTKRAEHKALHDEIASLKAALAQSRRAAIEECAKHLETYVTIYNVKVVADAIRALAGEQQP